MVRETGERRGEEKGNREGRIHYDRGGRIIIQSLNALGDVSCQNAYKIQLCDERGHSGHLCFV